MQFNSNAILVLCLFIFLEISSVCASGDLDLTFGNRGRAVVATPGQDWGAALAFQPDGKIVTAGNSGNQFALTRHDADGVIDSSFGVGGRVVASIPGWVETVLVQPDGKIVAAGTATNDTGVKFMVARFNPDGSPDVSFNGTGSKLMSFPGYLAAYAHDAAIQPDGKIVVVGYVEHVIPPPNFQHIYAFAIVRLNGDGSLDTSFNSTGTVVTNFSPLSLSAAYTLALQADGRVIVAGETMLSEGTNWVGAIARYNSDGSIDTTFSDDGLLTTTIGWTSDLAIQPDGKLIAAGGGFELGRYNSDGTIDSTFGSDGIASVIYEGHHHSSNSIALQPDGKIVICGGEYDTDPETQDTIYFGIDVARFNAYGSLDNSFGRRGRIKASLGDGYNARDVKIQSDGMIVAAGWGPDFDFLLARYRPSANDAFDFDGDGRSDVSVFRPSNRTWYLHRSTLGSLSTQFGLESDDLAPADYDGDGKTDIAVFRDGTWWRVNSANSIVTSDTFGQAGDIAIPADYTGDGQDELAVYRVGEWWSFDLYNGQVSVIQFGLASDRPIPADYDGDGRVDQAIYRNGEWHLNRSTEGYAVQEFGLPLDKLVAADYDGDGKADPAVYRDGAWHMLRSTQGYTTFPFGLTTDIPVAADYDSDGKTDAAVFRGGRWWILGSTSGVVTQQFGLPEDKPLPASFSP